MSSPRYKLRLIGAFAALAILALAMSCRGFFVNPTLTGVSIGPANLTINVNQTWQMTATGTYSDGSQKNLSSGVAWSSSDATTVSVGQTSGQVTGLQTGSATITASSGGCAACSGTTTVTVVLTGVTSITISPSSQSAKINGSPVYYTATASPGGDITQSAIWTVQDSSGTNQTSEFTLSFLAGSGEGIVPTTASPGTYKVIASYPGTTAVGTATLTVTQ
ncbi:MAG TPA: Ig-like domain-containing protein [Candidatus Sulfotelmatobacter sp.]|nr:Ig-like domain-containing protein [Candidatus Sulfotelmatobacter sp.]